MKHIYPILTAAWLLLAVQPAPHASAQDPQVESAATAEKVNSLLSIQESLNQLRTDLKEKQQQLRSPDAEGQREQITAEVRELLAQLRELEINFKEIASGVDIGVFTEKEDQAKVSWSSELSELMSPLLNELKEITSSPREIDRLQTEITQLEQKREAISEAIENVKGLKAKIENSALRERLEQTIEEWQDAQQTISTSLAVNTQKLEQRQSGQRTFSEALEHLFEVFFRRRGRNLFVAVLATLAFWLLIRRLHVEIEKLSPLHRKERSFAAGLFNVMYLVLTVVGTALVFILVLYLFGDWVLLILAVMLLLGLLWASKHTIPHSWSQATLLLNMGPVRERERVVYNGLPWIVGKINFYTQLRNPELAGSPIRLPINDLKDLRSRPYDSHEPWFPTRTNDWVVLNDETFGKIVLQSPESVRLVELGGAHTTYPAAEFLKTNPRVLSSGFRLTVTFGVDYRHQALVCEAIPQALEERLNKELAERGYSNDEVRLAVEFKEAGPSSLDCAVIADCKGEYAREYLRLRRLIQRLCVDACNANGWVIPFQQITLHLAGGETPLISDRRGAG